METIKKLPTYSARLQRALLNAQPLPIENIPASIPAGSDMAPINQILKSESNKSTFTIMKFDLLFVKNNNK